MMEITFKDDKIEEVDGYEGYSLGHPAITIKGDFDIHLTFEDLLAIAYNYDQVSKIINEEWEFEENNDITDENER